MGSYAALTSGFLLPQHHSQEECCDESKNPQVINYTLRVAILEGAVPPG